MRIPDTNRRTSVGANMTPMIDVVFLLIIFFLVSSHLARQENRLPLDLPSASSTGPTDLQRGALTINVNLDQQWVVRGVVVSAVDLRQILADHVARDGDAAALRIRCHRFVPYRIVQPVLRDAAMAGLTDVTLSVLAATTSDGGPK